MSWSFLRHLFLGDCKKLSVTYCNCFCFMCVSVVGWFCDSNFWLLKQPIIRSYFGWTLTPQKMEMWWTCEIVLKCVGLRIYIIYTYTVYYTYIYVYMYSIQYHTMKANWRWCQVKTRTAAKAKLLVQATWNLGGFSWEYTMKVMEVVRGSFLCFTIKIPLNPKEI